MKKVLSLFLSLVMVLGILTSVPIVVNAASTADLIFKKNSDGKSYYVADCTGTASGELTIPDTYNGKPVTGIGDAAFSWCTDLTAITLPESINSIGEDAFFRCTSLESVKIPGGVESIGRGAFFYCTELTEITIPDSVTSIGDDSFALCSSLSAINVSESNPFYTSFNGVLFNKSETELIQYPAGGTASAYKIPDSVTDLGDYAFYYCPSLTTIIIPDGLIRIGIWTFEGCTGLAKVNLSGNVAYIGEYAFRGCTGLTAINVPENNDTFSSSDGVLFNKSKTELLHYPMGKTASAYTIPGTVEVIGNEAFYGCKSLTKITLGNSVTDIGSSAFADCTSLTEISFPSGLISLGYRAFYNCKGLNYVTIPESVTSIGYTALGYFYNEQTYCDEKTEAFTICGKSGTAAETYANDNGFIFVELCYHTSTQWITDTPATCTKKGSKHKECTACKRVLETKAIPATGHTKSDWITDKKATVNAAGSKHKECTECGKTLETAKIAQLKPGRTTVKATTTSTGIKITWSKVTGADKYTVYRKTGDGSYKAIKTVTGTSYTDTTAKSGTKYKYNVKAKNEAGYGEYAKSGIIKLFLATPKVTVANASTGVTVKWNKITGAKGYYVYRKASGAKSWTKIATVKSGSTVSYTDKKASAGKKYYYTVKAYNGDYVSTTKASSIIEFLKAPTIKSVTSGKSGVTVKWAKATGADGYYVYRKTGSGSYTKIATVKGNTKVSYLDKSAKKGKTYTYYVKAYSGKSVSTSSKTLKIKDKY